METQTKNNPGRFAVLFIILAGMCWGITGIFTKNLVAEGLSALQIAFLRCAMASVILFAYLAIFDRKKLRIHLKDIWMFIGTGTLSLTMFSICYFSAIPLTGLSVAAVLMYTAPIFVMIMSAIFFKEKITSKKVLALILAFVGCVFTSGIVGALVSGGGLGELPVTGVLFAVGSGFGYALYSIFGSVAMRKYSALTVSAYTFLVAALSMLPFCIGNNTFAMLGNGTVALNTSVLAVVSTIMPYALYSLGLKYVEASRASVIAFSEPAMATVAGIVVFGEQVTVWGIAGIVLIFVSILILSLKRPGKPEE